MGVKKEEFSIEELNQLLVDLGVEESSPKVAIETFFEKPSSPQVTQSEPPPKRSYRSKRKNFIYPAALAAFFCLGFYAGILFASTLSLAKRAIQLEERIEERLDHLEKTLLPPPELNENRQEIIELLVESKNEKVLPKGKA
jgi:hypothetical protein